MESLSRSYASTDSYEALRGSIPINPFCVIILKVELNNQISLGVCFGNDCLILLTFCRVTDCRCTIVLHKTSQSISSSLIVWQFYCNDVPIVKQQ